MNNDGQIDLLALSAIGTASAPPKAPHLYLTSASSGCPILKATIGGKTVWQMREVSGGNYCQNDLRPNFGLGDATNVDLVRIEWPSGNVQELTGVPANQLLTIWEPPAIRAATQDDGACLLTITAEPNRTWRIEGSEDLETWQVVAKVANTTPTFGYTDSASAAMACRFYRVVAE